MCPRLTITRAQAGSRALVVGGANTDVVGTPDAALVARDSNPGHVRTSAGGVGRNIAENLARLGVPTKLITAFGRDEAGAELAAACRVAGVDVAASIVDDIMPSARYLAIVDEAHDLYVAVNDMRVIELVTPAALDDPGRAGLVAEAGVVVADTNLSAATLRWLAAHAPGRLVVDPVSFAKAGRLAGLLPALAAVTPSAAEAGVLLGRSVESTDEARIAAEDLVLAGVGAAFVTCGPGGVAWADASGSGTIPAPRVEIANTNGAGDAFAAGVAYAVLAGVDAEAAAALGSAMSAIALGDEETVSARIDIETVCASIEEPR